MRKLFSTHITPNQAGVALLVARIGVSIFMFTHGYGKMVKLFAGPPYTFGDPLNIGTGLSLGLAVFAEMLCSFLLLIGLGTRLATIPLIITMFVAGIVVNGEKGFKAMELPLIYLLIYIVILICGSGKYSVDHYINRRLKNEMKADKRN